MLAKIRSYGLVGINGYPVEVEIDINSGLPGIDIVGLPDAATKESKERVKSAIKNSGFLFTPKKITVNLAPADTKKEGASFDLPIALGILIASSQIDYKTTEDIVFVGELSLDGLIRPVKGILPIILSAKAMGYRTIVVPKSNSVEAGYVSDVDIYAFSKLNEVVDFLTNKSSYSPVEKNEMLTQGYVKSNHKEDFKYIKGQFVAKRAMEIAAAGGHNILMIGPPGSGKTMMAKCLPTILPDMSAAEAIQTTMIHSVAGVLDEQTGVILNRTFRTPHHTATKIALTGGGAQARPGEISLAHNGVLFLDELPEYKRETLEILRQPLEDGVVTISRAARTVEYPANFMLVASMNPCPCGKFGSEGSCSCTPAKIIKYRSKLSGPLMDRIDLHIEVDNVTYDALVSKTEYESSETIKERVNKARRLQIDRYKGSGIFCNANINNNMVKRYCEIDDTAEMILKHAFDRLGLSARAYMRILKVARTIADIEACERISAAHVAEAIQYRSLDRSYW